MELNVRYYQNTRFLTANREREEFEASMATLLIEGYRDTVNDLLTEFREMFQRLPFKYVGDSVLYSMFLNGISKGLSVDEAKHEVKRVMSREMALAELYVSVGRSYYFIWIY